MSHAIDRFLSWTRHSDKVATEGAPREELLGLLRAIHAEVARDREAVLDKIETLAAEVATLNQRLQGAPAQPTASPPHRREEPAAETCLYHGETDAFADHYVEWRQRRIEAIVQHYGPDFFAGKRVLELGCGYGDLGAAFAQLGAQVTCSDARPEHLEVVRKRYPQVKTVAADLDREWPFEGGWDLVLHLGLLYHLRAPEPSIRWACAATRHLVLETEVCDSLDTRLILRTQESGYDQAFNGCGCRPSTGCIETILRECGASFERLGDASCNSGMHVYDWTELNTGAWRHGLRRLWFVDSGAC